MKGRRKSLSMLKIPKFRVFSSECLEIELPSKNISCSDESFDNDIFESPEKDHSVQSQFKFHLDDLTTPRFNTTNFSHDESLNRIDESFAIDEHENDSQRIHKVKVSMCINTDKISPNKMLNDAPKNTHWILNLHDELNIKKTCSKNIVCGCSIF
jgi:hypothetical protein